MNSNNDNDKDSNVLPFTGLTTVDVPANRILEGVKDELDSVVVLGWDKEDSFYFAVSHGKKADILYLLELAKQSIMEV